MPSPQKLSFVQAIFMQSCKTSWHKTAQLNINSHESKPKQYHESKWNIVFLPRKSTDFLHVHTTVQPPSGIVKRHMHGKDKKNIKLRALEMTSFVIGIPQLGSQLLCTWWYKLNGVHRPLPETDLQTAKHRGIVTLIFCPNGAKGCLIIVNCCLIDQGGQPCWLWPLAGLLEVVVWCWSPLHLWTPNERSVKQQAWK